MQPLGLWAHMRAARGASTFKCLDAKHSLLGDVSDKSNAAAAVLQPSRESMSTIPADAHVLELTLANFALHLLPSQLQYSRSRAQSFRAPVSRHVDAVVNVEHAAGHIGQPEHAYQKPL